MVGIRILSYLGFGLFSGALAVGFREGIPTEDAKDIEFTNCSNKPRTRGTKNSLRIEIIPVSKWLVIPIYKP